ncbi:hypothetical protein NL676_017800 [Syzygium grande]|nr:hypothetical protein NL676_017800 [Syzygium grande]
MPHAKSRRGVDDGRPTEATEASRSGADADGLVGGPDVESAGVGVALDGDGPNPQPPRRPHDPASYLASARHQYLLDGLRLRGPSLRSSRRLRRTGEEPRLEERGGSTMEVATEDQQRH